MKKRYLLVSLLALALASCNETETSSTNSSSSTSISSSTGEISSTSTTIDSTDNSSSTTIDSTDSSSSSTTDTQAAPLLSYLNEGFAVQTIYSKGYLDSSNPSRTFYESHVADGVVAAYYFLGYKESFDEEAGYVYKQFQYEEGEDDGLIYNITYKNLEGELNKELVLLEDPISEEDVEMTFAESKLSNAFAKLQETDFTKEGDYFVLDMSEERLEDLEYANVVNSISAQFYPSIDGYVSHYFLKQDLVSLKIKVDAENKPLTFEMDLGQSESYGSISVHKMEGTFIDFGADVATKLSAPESKYEEFDEMIEALKLQNYEFMVRRNHTEDPSGWGFSAGNDCLAYGKSDGKNTFEVTNILNNTSYGYKQTSTTAYQKYTIAGTEKTATGDPIEGLLREELLPTFALSSAFFEKVADTKEYHYVAPKLITNPTMNDYYLAFDLSYGYYTVLNHFTVTINDDSIRFYNYHDADSDFYCDITFYNIGGVKEITANI